jgi:hypothetical protein
MALEKIRNIFVIFSLLVFIGSCTPPSNGTVSNLTREEIILQTFQKFELEEPYPEVQYVDSYHFAVEGPVIGRATRFNTGREIIYLEEDAIGSMRKFQDLFDHEVAHVKTWRVYGENIVRSRPHGIEYRQICHKYSERRNSCSAVL